MQDQEIYQSLGQKLHEVLPASAQKIRAKAEIGDDWSEVSFDFVDISGETRWSLLPITQPKPLAILASN